MVVIYLMLYNRWHKTAKIKKKYKHKYYVLA